MVSALSRPDKGRPMIPRTSTEKPSKLAGFCVFAGTTALFTAPAWEIPLFPMETLGLFESCSAHLREGRSSEIPGKTVKMNFSVMSVGKFLLFHLFPLFAAPDSTPLLRLYTDNLWILFRCGKVKPGKRLHRQLAGPGCCKRHHHLHRHPAL